MGKRAKATYAFEGAEEGEIKFEIDDILIITQVDEESGWWSGYLENDSKKEEGYFPGSYVSIFEEGSESEDLSSDLDPPTDDETPDIDSLEPDSTESYESDGDESKQYSIKKNYTWQDDGEDLEIKVMDTIKKGRMIKSKFWKIKSSVGSTERKWNSLIWVTEMYKKRYRNVAIPPLLKIKPNGRPGFDNPDRAKTSCAQMFLDRCNAHPVLRNTDFLEAFLSDSKSKVYGKKVKQIENAKVISLWRRVDCDLPSPDMEIENEINRFRVNLNSHNEIMKEVRSGIKEISLSRYNELSKSIKRLSGIFKRWGKEKFDWRLSAGPGAKESAEKVQDLLKEIGTVWSRVSVNYRTHGDKELNRINNTLNEYSAYNTRYFPVIKRRDNAQIAFHNASQSQRKMEMKQSTKQENLKKARLKTSRTKKVSDRLANICLVESEYYRTMRLRDMKSLLRDYIDSQIEFYGDIVKLFEEIRPLIDDIDIKEGIDF